MARGSQKKVKTMTTVKKITTVSEKQNKNVQSTDYIYVEDYWETSPKTDYTYARSATYRAAYSDQDYISPNMSRRRIRGDKTVTSVVSALTPNTNAVLGVPTYRSYTGGSSAKSQSSIVTRSQSRSRDSTSGAQASKRSYSQRSSLNRLLFGYRQEDERQWTDADKHQDAPDAGSDEGIDVAGYSGHQRHLQSERYSDEVVYRDTYTQAEMDKQLEYSGQPTSTKEKHINHLYDTESSWYSKSSTEVSAGRQSCSTASSQSVVSSLWSYLCRAGSLIMTAFKSVMMLLWISTVRSCIMLTSVVPSRQSQRSSTSASEHGSSSILWRACSSIYMMFARSVLLDASLHKRTNITRKRSRCCWLPLLFVLPLLLIGICLLFSNKEALAVMLSHLPFASYLSSTWRTVDTARTSSIPDVKTDTDMYNRMRQMLADMQQQQTDHVMTQQSLRMQQADLDKLRAQIQVLLAGAQGQNNKVHAQQAHLFEQHNDQISVLQKQLSDLTDKWQEATQQLNAANLNVTRQQEQIETLQKHIILVEEKYTSLLSQVKGCCTNNTALGILIQTKVAEALSKMMMDENGQGGTSTGAHNFHTWLHQHFVGQQDLDSKFSALASQILAQVKAETSKDNNNISGNVFVNPDASMLTEEDVRQMITKELFMFSADKTGMADYALESAGGSVISTRCSETYYRQTAQITLFGIPLWYERNSPRVVIQPDVHAGNCWAFGGSEGYLVIQLSGFIKITSFSLEHLPISVSPSGNIDSAPKHFTVWGLSSEHDRDGKQLGNHTYSVNGQPLQNFPVIPPVQEAFNFVELRIHSNHGNPEYTCIYRFRVHGVLKT